MSRLNCKSKPISIPLNIKVNNKYSLRNYNNYQYINDSDTIQSPRSQLYSNSYIYLKNKYSNDINIPNPFGRTPPNKDSFDKIYMNILANTYLNYKNE